MTHPPFQHPVTADTLHAAKAGAPRRPPRTPSKYPHVEAYIQAHLEAARRVHDRYPRIPVSLMLAQSGLETLWGKKVRGNAYFGVKATANNAGDKGRVRFGTTEYVQGKKTAMRDDFRGYGSWETAALDYARFLSDSPKYKVYLDAWPDVDQACKGFVANTYATDPLYAQKLAATLRSHGLLQLDEP